MKKIGLILSLIATLNAIGQTAFDGLRYSRNEITGTSRYVSMGGAFNALGGDATASLMNPAGVAVFRNNEFSTSLAFHQNSNASIYYQSHAYASTSNLSIPSFQIVGINDIHGVSKWKSQSFSVGTNHAFDYNQSYNIIGYKISESKLDYYTSFLNANKISYSAFGSNPPSHPFDLYLAWYQYLVDTIPGQNDQYFNRSGIKPVDQEYSVTCTGRKNQAFVNYAGNYDDRLYIGVGAFISSIRFNQTQSYTEYIDQTDTTTKLDNFNEVFKEKVTGSGIGLNAGIIYRVTDALRFGVSLNSPEYLRLTTNFDSYNTTDYGGNSETEQSPVKSSYKFNINTPARATFGLAGVIKKKGLVSFDMDVLDYRTIQMRGRLDGDPFTNENNQINNLLAVAVNYRAGAEYRITNFVAARAGAAYYENPFTSESNGNGDYLVYSIGGGYRTDQYFIDAAISSRSSSDKLRLFPSQSLEMATLNTIDLRIQFTCGWKF